MEESEKRRERLRAIRIEATDLPNPNPILSPSSSLSNPLLDKPDQNSQHSTARFGFYTDPMAAFSSDKRRCGPYQLHPSPPVTGIRNPEPSVSGGHQLQSSYSPYQNVHQGGQPYYSSHPPSNPMGWRSPSFVNQESPSFNSAPGRGHQFNNSPSPAGNLYPVYQGNPNFRSPPPIRGCWYNNSPYPDSSPGLGLGSSPNPGLGRGRGRWDGNNRGSSPAYSCGRGRGFNVDNRTRSFHHMSMVEDPWESLTPVIWKGDSDIWSKYNNQGSLHKTPTAKKLRVSDPFDKSNTKQSLAEFLSASFDEAVGDAAGS